MRAATVGARALTGRTRLSRPISSIAVPTARSAATRATRGRQERSECDQEHDSGDQDPDQFAAGDRAAFEGLEAEATELDLERGAPNGRSGRLQRLDVSRGQVLVLTVEGDHRVRHGLIAVDLSGGRRVERASNAGHDRDPGDRGQERLDLGPNGRVGQPAIRAPKDDRVVACLGARTARRQQVQGLGRFGSRQREAVGELGSEAAASDGRADQQKEPEDDERTKRCRDAPAGDAGHGMDL